MGNYNLFASCPPVSIGRMTSVASSRLITVRRFLIFVIAVFTLSSFGLRAQYYEYENTTKTLTITGEMPNFTYYYLSGNEGSNAPWDAYKTEILHIVINPGVTAIGNYAFYICSNLETVSIPGSLRTIGQFAFCRVDKMGSVDIPVGVKSIRNSAFENCPLLKNITIPEGVDTIGSWAFSMSSSLESITIPSSIKQIGNGAFHNCPNLTTVNILCETPPRLGASAFYYDDPPVFPAEIIVPCASLDAYKAAQNWSFYASIIKCSSSATTYKVTFDSQGGSSISELTNITAGAKISEPSTPPTKDGNTFGGWYKESGCLNAWDFGNDEVNSNITLYAKWTAVSTYYSYDGTTKTLTITGDMPDFAFYYNGPGDSGSDAPWDAYKEEILHLVINNGVAFIGENAFYNCTSLQSVSIPGSVASINEYAFYGCSSLVNVTIPEGVVSIRNHSFFACTNLESITLPSSLQNIGIWAFSECENLTSINIPAGVQVLGEGMFSFCEKLEKVELHEGLKTLGDYVFAHCSKLIDIDIPSSLTSIGEYAFQNCFDLETITIPAGVTTIGKNAFVNCRSLTTITSLNTTPPGLGSNALAGTSALTAIYVPSGSVDAYKNASVWKNYAHLINPDNTVYYTVSFDSQGGSNVNPIQNVTYGAKITAPNAPTKQDYDFAGWYREAGCVNEWIFNTEIVTCDTTLFAKWDAVIVQPAVYTVSFNSQGGSNVPDIQNVVDGTMISAPAAPTKQDYDFAGWYREAGCVNEWIFNTDIITCDTTLYAKWDAVIAPPAVYTVSFDSQGGSNVPDIQNVVDGTMISAPAAPTKPDYDFAGWYREAGCINEWIFASDVVTSNLTLYAKWITSTVSVTSVSLKGSTTLEVGQAETLSSTILPANATDKSVTWSSNNSVIVTVSATGVITAKAAGTAIITVTTNDGGMTATCTVTVVEPVSNPTVAVTGVSVSPTTLTLKVGEAGALSATVLPANATDKSVTWSNNNSTIATVSSMGVVTAIAVGTATITVITDDGGKVATCTVTVVDNVTANDNIGSITLSIFPNPVQNIATIKGVSEGDIIHLYSLTGVLIQIYTAHDAELKMDMSGLGKGIYLLKVNGKTLKLIKN